MTERRAARRYDLCLSVTVRAPSGAAGLQQQGSTRDISTRGVYLVLPRAISKDTDVDLTMVLPTELSGATDVLVRAVGRVVRVEEWSQGGGKQVGVATVIRRYEIVRGQPVPATRLAVKGF